MTPVKMTRAEYTAKYGVPPPASSVAQPPVQNIPSVTSDSSAAPASTPIKMTRAEYTAKFGTPPPIKNVSQETPQPENKSFLQKAGDLGKSLVTAPATIVARPFQAVEAIGQAIQDKPKLDQFYKDTEALNKEGDALLAEYKQIKAQGGDTTDIKRRIQEHTDRILATTSAIDPTLKREPTLFKGSSIVAPVPKNMGDVKKDVGRAVQTVALGTGAPIAGGAAFGLGSSLEQGNDLFSTQTLFNTVLGAGAGKVLDLVGKPLLNAAGKVVGTITPQVLKDVAAGGADAITKFAVNHELLGGVAKPLSEKIATGFQAVDENAGKLFKGTGSKVKDVISSQYPGLSKSNLQDRYTRIEQENFAKPTTEPKGTYKVATEIYNDAKAQGTDLGKVATDNKISHQSIINGNNYDTLDTANSLRNDAMKTSHDLIRPALAAAEPGVQRVPISTIRNDMLSSVDKIPKSQITDAERATIKDRINKEYGDNSAAAIAHPDGYTLTDLHDSKIATSTNANFRTTSFDDSVKSKQYKQESATFRKLLEDNAPAELNIKKFNEAIQQKFQLADYLEKLHGKKVPMGVVAKAVDLFGKVAGASVGSHVGGGLGGVAGYHLGGVLFDSFENLSNPLKKYYLSTIEKSQPEVFAAFKQYLGDQETARLMRLKLPAPNSSIAPDLMKKQNLFGGVEMGYTPKPVNKLENDLTQNLRIFKNSPQLPAPELRLITPNNIMGTPNVLGRPYTAGGEPEAIGGMRQRIGSLYTSPEEKSIAKKAADLTQKNGGVTINLKGDIPHTGFAYSPYKDVETIIPQAEFSQAHVDNFIEKNYNKLNEEGNHLGVWIDNGKVYLDISKVNPDENSAVVDSLKNNQIGLFDLSTFETKPIKDYEKIGDTYIYKRKK